jgi:hypothetical protein
LISTDIIPSGSAITTVRLTADGLFLQSGIVPGNYRAIVRTEVLGRQAWGIRDVVIGSQDVADLDVVARPATRIRGAVLMSDASAQLASPRRGVTVRLRQLGQPASLTQPGPGLSGSDGVFELVDVPPGRYVVELTDADGGMVPIESVTRVGSGLLDGIVEVEAASAPVELQILTAAAPSRLSGMLKTQAGQPVPSYGLVAFAAAPQHRGPGSHRIQFVVTANDGSFEFVGLPAGEYCIAAFSTTDADAVLAQEVLARLESAAVRVSLAVGEIRTFDLAVISR